MPPIQHNFKNLDEYNSYAKSRGMEELKPIVTKDEKGKEVKKDPDFPKSVWEVYASKDGNRNDNVGFSETGKDVKSVTTENAESLKNSLAKEDFFKGRSGAVAGYATAAWTRVSQNIDKLFASFKDVLAPSKHNIEDEASAKSTQETLDKDVDDGINDQTSNWTQEVSDDIQTQLTKALEIAQRELGQTDNNIYATKDEDHSQQIELKESGIEASAITGDVNIKEKVTEVLQSKEVIKNSGLDFSKIGDSAGSNLKAEAEKIIKTKYQDIKADPVKSEADLEKLNQSIETNITGQVAGMKSELSIDEILKQAEMDAMNQIRDEVDKDRKEGQVKAKYDELIKDIKKPTSEETKKLEAARQKDIEETTKTGKVTTTNIEEAAKAIKADREKEAGNTVKSSPFDAMATTFGTNAANAAFGKTTGTSTTSTGVTSNQKSDNSDTIQYSGKAYDSLSFTERNDLNNEKSKARAKWGSGSITANAYFTEKDKKDGSLGDVGAILTKVLSSMFSSDHEIVSELANNSKVHNTVVKGNPEVFDESGQVRQGVNWNSLKLPSVKKMKEIAKA